MHGESAEAACTVLSTQRFKNGQTNGIDQPFRRDHDHGSMDESMLQGSWTINAENSPVIRLIQSHPDQRLALNTSWLCRCTGPSPRISSSSRS